MRAVFRSCDARREHRPVLPVDPIILEADMTKNPDRTTYPAEMEEERKEPDGPGHDKPKPSDAPPSSIPTDVGKTNRVKPKD